MKRSITLLLAASVVSASLVAYSQTQPGAGQPSAGQPGAAPAANPQTGPAAGGLNTVAQKASYAIGLNMGRGMKSEQFEVDLNALIRGLTDGFTGANPALSEQQIQEAIQTLQRELAAKQAEVQKVAGDRNKKEGETFLAANKEKEGVKTTASGLQYKVLKSGNGPSPGADDAVVANYLGTFIDGTKFDASEDHGGPATFPVKGVIPGWTEALQMMKVGDKWQIFVPSDLAYGEHGHPPVIGPNSTLIFEIELVDVKKQQ